MPFLDEIAAKLVADGVGTLNGNIFIGPKAPIPPDAGPYLTLTETGGTAPSRVQNKGGPATQKPTAQILCRAQRRLTARAMVQAAYDSLDGTWNETLSGVLYQSITARQEPTDLGGLDEANRVMLSFNIDVEKNPS